MSEPRPERPDDVTGIRSVLLAAFDGDGEARLVDALRGSDAWLPRLSVVAVADRQVVAYALLSRIVLNGTVPALALGPVAVRPDRQRRGHGTAVTRAVLDAAGDTDAALVVVLGDPAYYGRFGFEPGADHGVTGAWSSFADAWQVLPLRPGVPAGEVRYPPPWAAL